MVFILVFCLGYLGIKAKVYLWVFACLSNAFGAPMWPGGLTWTDRYIVVSGVVFTIMNLGAGVSCSLSSYLVGWIFTNRDPNSVIYVLFFCAVFMCVIMVIMQIIGSKHGERFGSENVIKRGEKKQCIEMVNVICGFVETKSVASSENLNMDVSNNKTIN